ncbi:hypothetical protein BCR42DRAFT_456185 [Absidia repens]|uniref:C3H1-type domain-containing protein n=1 Tax=Absidia repens TaxID=90262 RepID=A0A1X2I0Z0_9FUNG|nr:hypothetical protein BCR42DRAFT_456185 [Absidia repens]
MPPKKQQGKTKAEKAKSAKSLEDKTFGMKNKNKSTKVQKYIQTVKSQAKHNDEANKSTVKRDIAEKKAAEEKRKLELQALFQPVQIVQKVPFGTDPKSVLCVNFKNGHCDKGVKCKFSHDPNVNRKVDKKDLYTDSRKEKEADTMDGWDQEKLEKVVNSKSGKQPPTDIVCKYFLEAIENNKYGWFWECTGGVDCKYKHALPPGFILKSKNSKVEEKSEISLEEFLESERHKLGSNLTPVTLETFNEWKKSRMVKKDADEAAVRKAKETRWKAGRSQGMSGRDLFDFNPALAENDDDDDDAFDLTTYDRDEVEREKDRLEQERIATLMMGGLSVEQAAAVVVNEK